MGYAQYAVVHLKELEVLRLIIAISQANGEDFFAAHATLG